MPPSDRTRPGGRIGGREEGGGMRGKNKGKRWGVGYEGEGYGRREWGMKRKGREGENWV